MNALCRIGQQAPPSDDEVLTAASIGTGTRSLTVAAPDDTTVREHTDVPALDGLRAVAVLLVMAQHLHAFVYPASSFLPKGGYLGVDLFFVLSGFLITSLLLEERASTGGVSFRRFYRRRAFRLFPALAAFTVVQAAAAVVARQSLRDQVHFWVGAFTYTTNWVMARGWSVPANTGHLWSLAVEEQFYLVWPVAIVLAMRRWGARSVPVLCIAGIGAAVVSRVYLTHRFGFGYPYVYLHTETRFDGLLLGALVAWARHTGWRPSSRFARTAGWAGLVIVGLYVLGTSPTDQFLYEQGGYTVLALAATAVLVGLLDPRWGPARLLATRAPVEIGKLSYSLYLWHMVVVFILLSFLQDQSLPVGLTLYAGASFALAVVSYRFVESPLRALGHAAQPDPVVTVEAAPRVPARRSSWGMAGAGAAALLGLAAVPAYAQRDEILGRDRAVAAALAAQESPTPTTALSVAEGAPPQPVTLTVEAPATTPPPGLPDPTELVVAATLADASGLPMADRPIRFESAAGECEARTDDVGRASCSVPLPEPPADVPATPPVPVVEATYEGDEVSVSATATWP